MVDKFEKVTRGVLWLVLSATCVLGLLGHAAQSEAEARAAKETQARLEKAAAAEHAERTAAPQELRLKDMAQTFERFDGTTAHLYTANLSARSGVLCVRGQARGETKVVAGLATCTAVAPYQAPLHIESLLPSGDLSEVCPRPDSCVFDVVDAL